MLTVAELRKETFNKINREIDELVDGCKASRDTSTFSASLYYGVPIVPIKSYDCEERKRRIYDLGRGACADGMDLTHLLARLSTWEKYQCSRCTNYKVNNI